MVIQWVSHLFRFRPSRNRGFGLFPDDILVDILSRLPADAVLRCRRVCRHWRTLTSSADFVALQNQRAPSVLLLQGRRLGLLAKTDYFVYDALAKELRKIPFKSRLGFEGRGKTMENETISLRGACGPLLHLKASGYYNWTRGVHNFAFNLITRQLGALKMRKGDFVCGLFFNEARSEYNYLSFRFLGDKSGRFYVYSLDSRTDVEIACSPFLFGRCSNQSPVVANRAVFLMVERTERDVNRCMHAILVFEMDSGKFYNMPHPQFECPGTGLHHFSPYSYLFVHDGHLCLGRRDIELGLLYTWTLVDYANWSWAPLGPTIALLIPKGPTGGARFTILSVRKDELLVYWDPSLFLVNVKDESVEEIKLPYKWLPSSLSLVAYRSTLAAPRLVWDEGKSPLFSL
ncbi:unnamed protein product [Cuscuta campestris]|uniref:F-box domain-containing protein n=1 Tax=Cuscuta campestris TaxID=132261 RepID=A0A484NEX6_9ASTE|nr:unnamed protein product [Cuscuta campestris]